MIMGGGRRGRRGSGWPGEKSERVCGRFFVFTLFLRHSLRSAVSASPRARGRACTPAGGAKTTTASMWYPPFSQYPPYPRAALPVAALYHHPHAPPPPPPAARGGPPSVSRPHELAQASVQRFLAALQVGEREADTRGAALVFLFACVSMGRPRLPAHFSRLTSPPPPLHLRPASPPPTPTPSPPPPPWPSRPRGTPPPTPPSLRAPRSRGLIPPHTPRPPPLRPAPPPPPPRLRRRVRAVPPRGPAGRVGRRGRRRPRWRKWRCWRPPPARTGGRPARSPGWGAPQRTRWRPRWRPRWLLIPAGRRWGRRLLECGRGRRPRGRPRLQRSRPPRPLLYPPPSPPGWRTAAWMRLQRLLLLLTHPLQRRESQP